MEEAIVFRPLFMERPWGGRRLAERFGKALPPEAPIGESWELVDRPDAASVVTEGPLAGTTLGDLWRHRRGLFGARAARAPEERFPLLVKLLDAHEVLSVQVHPPAAHAARLGGEPKSETWLVLDATPDAHIFAGFRAGTTREAFEAALAAGEDISRFLHRIDVRPGDAIHIPSGRIHALGPGCLILEVQQNSDTTYRVFDWNRPGLDGCLRELHVHESLASIDFADVEPTLDPPAGDLLSHTDWFALRRCTLRGPRRLQHDGECVFVAVSDGRVRCGRALLDAGDVALLPPDAAPLEAVGPSAEVVAIDLP